MNHDRTNEALVSQRCKKKRKKNVCLRELAELEFWKGPDCDRQSDIQPNRHINKWIMGENPMKCDFKVVQINKHRKNKKSGFVCLSFTGVYFRNSEKHYSRSSFIDTFLCMKIKEII